MAREKTEKKNEQQIVFVHQTVRARVLECLPEVKGISHVHKFPLIFIIVQTRLVF